MDLTLVRFDAIVAEKLVVVTLECDCGNGNVARGTATVPLTPERSINAHVEAAWEQVGQEIVDQSAILSKAERREAITFSPKRVPEARAEVVAAVVTAGEQP